MDVESLQQSKLAFLPFIFQLLQLRNASFRREYCKNNTIINLQEKGQKSESNNYIATKFSQKVTR